MQSTLRQKNGVPKSIPFRSAFLHDTNNRQNGKMNYITFRKNYKILINLVGFLFVTLSVFLSLIWKDLMFYAFGIICFLCVVEAILVKCPSCGKKPINLIRRFPDKCPFCKTDL